MGAVAERRRRPSPPDVFRHTVRDPRDESVVHAAAAPLTGACAMTAERVRRVLARLCSETTLTGIIDPILADMRWERDRPSWLGYAALVTALAVHSTLSIPDALGRAWRDDQHAVPRIAGLVLASALVAAVALTALPLTFGPFPMKSVPLVRLVVLLLPQALVLTLPAALLLAVPMPLRTHA